MGYDKRTWRDSFLFKTLQLLGQILNPGWLLYVSIHNITSILFIKYNAGGEVGVDQDAQILQFIWGKCQEILGRKKKVKN